MTTTTATPPTRVALTERQAEVLAFIANFTRDVGYAPSIKEIGHAFALASTNGVHDHLCALQAKGWISRTPNVARSIVVLATPSEGDVVATRGAA